MYAMAFGSILTTLIGMALMVRLYNLGYSVWVRLFVAVISCALMIVTYGATTDSRPLGYWPEAVLAISVAFAVIVACVRSYQDTPSQERASLFRSLF